MCVIFSAQVVALEKKIAITFDDAPRGDGPMYSGNERGAALLKALAKANVKQAAFFITTGALNKPGNLQRISNYAKAGHIIANHSHSHLWLKDTPTDKYLADLDEAERLLSGISNRRPWFRFPYLDEARILVKRDEVRRALEKRKLFNGYVTVDNFDWHIERQWKQAQSKGEHTNISALKQVYIDLLISSIEFYDNMAIDALGRSPAHVLLLHENDVAVLFIGELVEVLRGKGWSIISADQAYQDPIARMTPKTLLTGNGRVAALAIDSGLSAVKLAHWGSNEKEINAALNRNKVFNAN
jgi:peptidoglycan/xylan/chitin deacetylase (PgdA/CDA1 family)